MRAKTRRPRARPSKSPRKPSYTTSAPPIPPTDPDYYNAEPEASIDGILQEKSRKGDVHRKKHKVSDEADSSSEEKGSGLDGKKVDWLKNDACLRCNSDGNLIFCSEISCPLAFHRECMEFEPKFDEKGRFYCPYCWFKLQVSRTLVLREKAMLAKRALLDFVDSKTIGEDEEKQNDRRAEGKSPTEIPPVGGRNDREISDEVKDHQNGNGSKKIDKHDHLGGVVEIECHGAANVDCSRKEKIQGVEPLDNGSMHEEKRNDEKIPHPNKLGVLDGEGMKEPDDELVDDSVADKNVKEPSNVNFAEEKTIPIDTPNGDGEPLHQDARETTVLFPDGNMTSRGGEAAQKVPETSDMDSEAIAMRQKRFKRMCTKKVTQPQNANSQKKGSIQPKNSEAKSGNQIKKANSPENSRRPKESATAFANLHFAQDKRKRLYWTPEEEDMLKEGVQKFSTEVNKNIPWRKILEFGRHIFHTTRTPNDLRDKWRKIVVKDV